MKPSEELLAIREECAGSTDADFVAASIRVCSLDAWHFMFRETEGVYSWLHDTPRTHLEVVEMIERAAVAAIAEENGT